MNTNMTFNFEGFDSWKQALRQRFFQQTIERNFHEHSTYNAQSEAEIEKVVKAIPTTKEHYTYLPLKDPEHTQHHLFDLGDTLILVSLTAQYSYNITGASEKREKLDKIMASWSLV